MKIQYLDSNALIVELDLVKKSIKKWQVKRKKHCRKISKNHLDAMEIKSNMEEEVMLQRQGKIFTLKNERYLEFTNVKFVMHIT